jgi:hemoglobin
MYEAIGGRQKLNAAVRIFYEKVLKDPKLSPFLAGANMDGLRAKQVMFLSMLLGGGKGFARPDIRGAHGKSRQAGLTDAHFDAFVAHFRATLEEIGVETEIVEKVMQDLESTRKEVLGR